MLITDHHFEKTARTSEIKDMMELKLTILSTILLLLTLSNTWHTEAIVVPMEKLEEDLFVVGDEDEDGDESDNVDSTRVPIESPDLDHNNGIEDVRMEETEAVLIPAGWRRFRSRIRSGLRRIRNIYRRVPIPIFVRVPL
ncbi:unnamed protein product [Rodentolepis nana]|uniref:Expressed conserved protein n=1 Tax=Rodentolepis nana TaxID=102285 RepID=A0A0R3TCX6_RODNA|nr:unnamed protein product [Rodentolepis nana]